MGQKILSYSTAIAISLFLLLSVGLPIQAQQRPYVNPTPKRDQKKKKKEEPKEIIPLYNGTYIGVDLYGIGSKLFGGDFLSSEVNVTVNLKNMFLPSVDVGYGTTDSWNETGIHYKSSAPFFRIGLDYNTMAKKKEKNSFLYVGLRYGFSHMKYDISSMPMTDPAFGGEIENPNLEDNIWGESVPYDYPGQKATMHWLEFVAGVKVQIYRNFYMGWAVRMKYRLSASLSEYGNPWMVPGFGKYSSKNMGVTYSLIYKLPY
ncbi:DUF6048 family protein [Bacteroides sp.]